MTGYESKRAMAQDKLAQPEQEPISFLAQPWVMRRKWVDLTEKQIEVIEEIAITKQWAIRMTIAQLKECNA